MAEVTQRAEQQQESQKTLVGTIISTPFQFLGVMFGSLVGAIIVEWVCLYFFWPDAGWKHAQAMFEYELSWLSQGCYTASSCRSQVEPPPGWPSWPMTGCS